MSDPTTITIPEQFTSPLARARAALDNPQGATYAYPIGPEPLNRESREDAEARRGIQRANRKARWEARRPLTYRDATLADFDPENPVYAAENGPARPDPHILKQVDRWITTSSALTLILAGNVGAGKTHLAYAIGNDLVKTGMWCEAWTVHDYLKEMRPDGDNGSAAKALVARLLILDDLGATKPTEWAVDEVCALLDSRVRNQRRTIITTNLTGDELQDAWGARLVDRMNEQSASIVFTGESRRRSAW